MVGSDPSESGVKYLQYLETKGTYENIRDVQVSKVKGTVTHPTLTRLRYSKVSKVL
jgi:phage gp16-like protein